MCGLFSLLFLSLMISSCGGGGGGGGGSELSIATIKIASNSSILTTENPEAQLTGIAYDSNGTEIETNLTWLSSSQTIISVDEFGIATRLGPTGSTTIIASADGVSSNSLVLLAATPTTSAILVSDSQVTGTISISEPDVTWGVGSHYEVTLMLPNTPPVGALLVGTGEEPISGRVVNVTENGSSFTVELEVVGLDVLFDELKISEQIDLSHEPFFLDQFLSDNYEVATQSDGTLDFTLKASLQPHLTKASSQLIRASSDIRAIGTSLLNPDANFGPFTCSTTLSDNPFTLTANPADISVSTDLDAIIEYDSTTGDNLQKLALIGKVDAKYKAQMELAIAVDGKVDCKFKVLEIPVPIPGPLAPVLGTWVPIGIGFEAGGKLELELLDKVTLELEGGGVISAGVENNPSTGWGPFADVTLEPKKPKFDFTPVDLTGDYVDLYSQLRLKPQAMLFGSADMELGIRGSRIIQRIVGPLRAQLLSAKVGPKFSGDFAIVEGQIEAEDYKSEYKLEMEASVSQGETVGGLLNRFGINISSELFKFTDPWATSPQAALVDAEIEAFPDGETVEFLVNLNPSSASIPIFGYNVSKVLIYREPELDSSNSFAELVASTEAIAGQTEFALQWDVSMESTIEGKYYAFVQTYALPVDSFGTLEIGELGVSFPGRLTCQK
ncbi:MAG: hypothetical protein RQ754_12065 [Desulfuromonadales bacterium]|nr:hypothetical protein [Desulfuromonadales bacterium]